MTQIGSYRIEGMFTRIYYIFGTYQDFPTEVYYDKKELESVKGNKAGSICKTLVRKIFEVPFVNCVIVYTNDQYGVKVNVIIDHYKKFEDLIEGTNITIDQKIISIITQAAKFAEPIDLNILPPKMFGRIIVAL